MNIGQIPAIATEEEALVIRNASNGSQERLPMRQKDFCMGNGCMLRVMEDKVGKDKHKSKTIIVP